jgi:serine/threonine-protein kinase HipA
MTSPALPETLWLWWLGSPETAQCIGTLQSVRRAGAQHAGVALQYSPEWLAQGWALSEDLPLRDMLFMPQAPDAGAGAVDDARPDRWGERVIRHIIRPQRLSILDYLYFAGDNRFGALGVSLDSHAYKPYPHNALPGLEDVQQVHNLIRQIEAGLPLDSSLLRLISPVASLGGAKPKAQVLLDGEPWILKFPEQGEHLDSGLIEHACMTLAARAGIDVCTTRPLAYQSQGQCRHAIAVKRFDRLGQKRLHAVSAHVALRAAGVDYSYPELALWLRRFGPAEQIKAHGEQVFRRMVFNILMDNTDDHEKNHAMLKTGNHYVLSPAFDLLPTGQGLGYQSMIVGTDGAEATLDNAMSMHKAFGLSLQHAKGLVAEIIVIKNDWQQHFAKVGVNAPHIEELAVTLDRLR